MAPQNTWAWCHHFFLETVDSSIRTYQEQVPKSCEWPMASGMHHTLSGGEEDQQEGAILLGCDAS